MTHPLLDVHATQGDIEEGLRLRIKHPHETAIVATGRMLMTDDKVEGALLGQTADGRRGMKRL